MIETLITAGYIMGGVCVLCSIVGYFVFPKMIKTAFVEVKTDKED